jgi:RNase P/RNase MRP subunit POP5
MAILAERSRGGRENFTSDTLVKKPGLRYMVRFKNRYLLIQLLPFQCPAAGEDKVISLRQKRRYIEDGAEVVVGVEDDKAVDDDSITKPLPLPLSFDTASVVGMLRHELEVNFGIQGSAALSQSLTVKYTNTATGMIILRCPRDHVQRVLSTVAWISHFPQSQAVHFKCTWRVIHCAGTIKACQQAAIAFAKREGKLTPELSKKLKQLER